MVFVKRPSTLDNVSWYTIVPITFTTERWVFLPLKPESERFTIPVLGFGYTETFFSADSGSWVITPFLFNLVAAGSLPDFTCAEPAVITKKEINNSRFFFIE